MKAKKLNVSPEDSRCCKAGSWRCRKSRRLYGVPPPLVGDWSDATFCNTASANSWFGSQTLLPWVKAIEAEFARVVFNDPVRFHLELDLSAMMRGDFATQAGVGINLVRAGVATPNELREQLGMNPRPEGDVLQPQAVGGRPGGTGDGEGDALPEPGVPSDGSGRRPNGGAPGL